MIETENLSYTYPHSQSPVLRNLSLHIPTGALACLLGNNGSGKTTLLHVLAGLLKPQGTLRLWGQDPPQDAAKAGAAPALLPQEPDLYILGSTVAEDLNLSLNAHDAAANLRGKRVFPIRPGDIQADERHHIRAEKTERDAPCVPEGAAVHP